MEKFEINLAGIKLEHFIMNAAGTCKTLGGTEGVKRLVNSNTSVIMVGSFTLEKRVGNSGDVYDTQKGLFSLNSMGLPNPGADYYRKYLPEMVKTAHEKGKPLFVSVAGFTPDEYAELASLSLKSGANLIELNLGCPNIWEGRQQKHIACFYPLIVEEILRCVEERVGEKAKISVKLSPFSNPSNLKDVAQVIERSELVKAVVSMNTFPNAFAYDESGKPLITPGGGLSGLAGPAIKPIGLGQIKQLRAFLPDRIDLVGVGGIVTAEDILDYLRVGAKAVQVATIFLDRGVEIFNELLFELSDKDII